MATMSEIYQDMMSKEAGINEVEDAGFEDFMKIAEAEGLSPEEAVALYDEVDDDDDDVMGKEAAFEQGIIDELEKAAAYGIDPDEVMDYLQGAEAGEAYGDGRDYVADAIDKMAGARWDRTKNLFSGSVLDAKKDALKKAIGELKGEKDSAAYKDALKALKKQHGVGWERAKVWGTRAGTPLAAGALGYGGYRLATRKKDRR